MICKNCHNNNIDGVEFCFYCGCKMSENIKAEPIATSDSHFEYKQSQIEMHENDHMELQDVQISNQEAVKPKDRDDIATKSSPSKKNKKVVVIGCSVIAFVLIIVGVVAICLNNKSDNFINDFAYSSNYYDYINSDNEPDNSNSESLTAEIEYDEEDSSLGDAYYFNSARASSVLPDEFEYSYSASNVLENNAACWCEGSSGLGVGEWIELELPETQLLYGLDIINGYAGTQKQYTYNGKVNKICLEFSDGTTLHTSLKVFDVSNRKKVQTIKFNYPVETSYVRITIEGVDAGECDDTCITYIAPYDR